MLWLNDNNIKDFSVIKGLSNLEELCCASSDFSDLSLLKGMKKLKSLNMGTSKVTDLSPLADLTGITHLDFDRCQISDISAFEKHEQSEKCVFKLLPKYPRFFSACW